MEDFIHDMRLFANSEDNIADFSKSHALIGSMKNSFEDYLSARILFLNDMLPQACIMANMSIERLLKTILLSRGLSVSKTHDICAIYHYLRNKLSDTSIEVELKKIQVEFLTVLNNLYSSRYFDNLKPGFNYTIIKNKFLAELDFTFQVLNDLSNIKGVLLNDPEGSKSKYQICVERKEMTLFDKNYILQGISKNSFLDSDDLVFEYRILDEGQHLELSYSTDRTINDGKFIYPALVQKSATQFLLSQGGIVNFYIAT